MSRNLPDDVTPADIDDAFGGEPDEYLMDVMLGISFNVEAWSEEDARDKLQQEVQKYVNGDLEVEHIEVVMCDRA